MHSKICRIHTGWPKLYKSHCILYMIVVLYRGLPGEAFMKTLYVYTSGQPYTAACCFVAFQGSVARCELLSPTPTLLARFNAEERASLEGATTGSPCNAHSRLTLVQKKEEAVGSGGESSVLSEMHQPHS
jgi:hypothetical protein